jgi:hypothetical protein
MIGRHRTAVPPQLQDLARQDVEEERHMDVLERVLK